MGKRPLEGGAFDARALARTIRAAWDDLGEDRPKGEEMSKLMGLEGASAWTKRTHPENKDFVPFRADELSLVVERLFPDEPWRPFVDPTTARVFREALLAKGLSPPGRTPEPPASAPREHQAGPKGPRRGTGRRSG